MKRIWHPWDKWECFKAGFYNSLPPTGISKEDALNLYADFLKNTPRFKKAALRVLIEWPISCEQFLSNEHINRIAWIGQSSMCIETGVPSSYRAGFKLLTEKQQAIANHTAQQIIDHWIKNIYPQMRLL